MDGPRKEISINLQSNGECGELRAYDCIELLAYILLEYANAGTNITMITLNMYWHPPKLNLKTWRDEGI